MSLVNLRQMCIIETPPTDRFPVQTYVTEYDTRIVRDAVMREKDGADRYSSFTTTSLPLNG